MIEYDRRAASRVLSSNTKGGVAHERPVLPTETGVDVERVKQPDGSTGDAPPVGTAVRVLASASGSGEGEALVDAPAATDKLIGAVSVAAASSIAALWKSTCSGGGVMRAGGDARPALVTAAEVSSLPPAPPRLAPFAAVEPPPAAAAAAAASMRGAL